MGNQPVIEFKKATRKKINISMLISGISGSGKSYTAMSLGTQLGKTAVIDTEGSSAEKYAELFDFSVHSAFTPKDDWYNGNDPKHDPRYIAAAIRAAIAQGFDVVIVDSLTSAWDWVMRYMDNLNAGGSDTKGFRNWDKVNPIWAELTDLMQAPPCHILWTARSKMTHAMETDPSTNRTVIKKLGLEAILRPQTEFYPDITAEMSNQDGVATLTVSKSRCLDMKSGDSFENPSVQLAAMLKQWADTGVQVSAKPVTFAKPDLSPDVKFQKLQDWFLEQEAKYLVNGMSGDVDLGAMWSVFESLFEETDEAERFFESLAQGPHQESDSHLYALNDWLQGKPSARQGHITNWRASSYGQVTQ